MTNEELIAQARELCEGNLAHFQKKLKSDYCPKEFRAYITENINSWTTHLAEMDEHKNAFVERDYNIFESVEGWYCQGCFERNDCDTPCRKLVTKAKRLSGGSEGDV